MAQQDNENQKVLKKSKKVSPGIPMSQVATPLLEFTETKATIKITFDGETAQKILKCESELRERFSKPDMGKIIGNEILTWSDKRWSEIVEENTDMDFFFAQIRKCSDKSKSIKLLKALSEKLTSESPSGSRTQASAQSESATLEESQTHIN